MEVMIAVGLMSILFFSVSQLTVQFQKNTQTYRRSVIRDNLMQNVARFSNLPQQLYNSITAVGPYSVSGVATVFPDNTRLRNCINIGGAADCTANTWYGFTLMQGANGSRLPLSGTSGEGGGTFTPFRYTSEGGACDTASITCPIRVYTSFRASCPASAAACDAAASLEIKYTIDQDPTVDLNPQIRTVTNDPAVPGAQPMLSVAIPLAAQFNGAIANSLSYWSSTTDLATSNVYQHTTGQVQITSGTFTGVTPKTLLTVDGAIRPGSAAGEPCDNTRFGAIRRDEANDSLQVCSTNSAGAPVWKWIAGGSAPSPTTGGSGGSTGGTAKYPFLPNLYLCTVGGTAGCGGLPPCVGQVTHYGHCCNGAGLSEACSQLK